MIYLKKTTEVQTIYIPRQEVLGTAYTSLVKGYEDGYKDGLKAGAEDQKSQLINLYVTENGEYERENGYGKITVDVPQEIGGGGDCPSYKNITDVYATPKDKVITFAAKVAVKGNMPDGKMFLILSDDKETIWARGDEDLSQLNEGDECLFTGLVYYSGDYVSVQDVRADELLSSGNNIAMPISAIEENAENYTSEIYVPDENGIIKAKYVYLDGTISGMLASTNRFRFKVTTGSKTANFTLSAGKPEWVEQYAVGDEIRIYGFLGLNRTAIIPATVIKKGEPCVINNEEKSIYIDVNGHYDVYPDSNYDGLSKVGIDVNINCNYAYEEGYNVGYQAAIGELTEISVTENGRYEGKFSAVNVDVPTGGGSCNLEDKWVTPSMNDRDGNGFIVVTPSEGYDGLSRTVIDPQTIYNEGKAEGGGGEGGSCNLEAVDINASPYEWAETINPSEGYDGLSSVIVRYEEAYAQKIEEGKNNVLNSLGSLSITENGTYNINDTKTEQMLNLGQDGNVWYTTDYNLSSSSRVEIYFIMVNDNHEEQTLMESGNLSIRLGGGGIRAVVNDISLWNLPYDTNTNTVNNIFLRQTGFSVNGQFRTWGDNDVYVDLWEQIQFGSPIIIGKGFKNGLVAAAINDTILYPNQDLTFGGFANMGTGTPTFEEKELRIYGGYGWKEVTVDVDVNEIDEYNTVAFTLTKTYGSRPIIDSSKLVGYFGGYTPNGSFIFNSALESICVTKKSDFSHGDVCGIEQGAIDWSVVEKMYAYNIYHFGENMTADTNPNLRYLYVYNEKWIDNMELSFRDGCFKNCSKLNKIVFQHPYGVIISGNPFEGVSETGQVIVVATESATNLYQDLMNALPSGWTLTFDADYIIE